MRFTLHQLSEGLVDSQWCSAHRWNCSNIP